MVALLLGKGFERMGNQMTWKWTGVLASEVLEEEEWSDVWPPHCHNKQYNSFLTASSNFNIIYCIIILYSTDAMALNELSSLKIKISGI